MTNIPIIWACIATVLGIAAGLGWMRCARTLAEVHKTCLTYYDRMCDAELWQVEVMARRHHSARHARKLQLAQQRAAKEARTAQLRSELQASLVKAERLAA